MMRAKPEFHELSAASLAAGLESGQWKSADLTSHFLNRIKKNNPIVHAIPFALEAEALAQARESDSRRAQGKPLSRIDGLPMTIKDTIRIKGYPTTYGMWFTRNYRPKSDSRMIDALRKNGVVFLGRSAIPTAAFDWNCRNQVYEECVNPIDPSRTPGGSSGGAAAALAAGMTPLELGSDIGGSIRYPAHCCGVFGLRTTDGWLPIDDVGPEGSASGAQQLLTFGPMARSVEDLDLLLDVFAKSFPKEELEEEQVPTNAALDIAYSSELLGMLPEPQTKALFDRFLDLLRARGHRLVDTRPDFDFDELFRDWGVISGFELLSPVPRVLRPLVRWIVGRWLLDRRLGPGPVTTYFKIGMSSTPELYEETCRKRSEILRKVDQFFRQYSLWILPVAPSSAVPRALMSGKRFETPSGSFEYTRYLGSYTVPTTYLGTPALAFPVGFDDAKLPVAVQIHGPRFSDRWLTRWAQNLDLSGQGGFDGK